MRLPSALRTAAFRLTAIYALLFAISLAAILAIVTAFVQRSMLDQVATAAREDVSLLVRAYQRTDRPTLESLSRARAGRQTSFFVRRADGTEVVAEFRPPGVPVGPFTVGDTRAAEPHDDDLDSQLIGYGEHLPDGTYLAAARDDEPVTETMEAVLRASVIAGILAVTLGVLGGLLMSAFYLRRVDALDRAATAIFDGDMGQRMPTRGTGDEFDRLAASLNRMLDRIAALMDGLRQVSTDVAHDLRTPLSRLRQRLEDFGRSDLTHAQRAALDGAVSEADGILSIFTALLQIAQVEGGSMRKRFDSVDLSVLVSEVGEIYDAVAEGAGHTLTIQAQPGATVRGNRELLLQLLVNLIENAITHTPSGTEVAIGVTKRGREVVLEVADDGPGIPTGERDRVFRRFHRLDASRSTPGTGLGLALVSAIAEIHDVSIEVEDNRPGLLMILTFVAPEA